MKHLLPFNLMLILLGVGLATCTVSDVSFDLVLQHIQLLQSQVALLKSRDSLTPHIQSRFSTKDQDNDIFSSGSCVVTYKGAWWYRACHSSNLKGLYHHGSHTSYADGVNWQAWKGYRYLLKFSEMKIRPVY